MLQVVLIAIAVAVNIISIEAETGNTDRQKLVLRHATIDTTQVKAAGLDLDLADLDLFQHYIVQFRNPIPRDAKQRVRDLVDHDLDWYIPYNAFVVYTNHQTIVEIQSLNAVVWTGIWKPEYKYIPSSSAFQALQDERKGPYKLTVFLAPSSNLDLAANDLRSSAWTEISCSFDGRPLSRNRILLSNLSLNGMEISTDSQLNTIYTWLSHQPEIYSISQHSSFKLNNYWAKSIVQNDDPAGRNESNLLFAQHGIRGQDQVVGIADSGIAEQSCFFRDPNHDLIVTEVIPGKDHPYSLQPSNHRKILQYIAPKHMGDAFDDVGHGTHVAGTIAGQILSDPHAIAKFNGIAPEARIAFFGGSSRCSTIIDVPYPMEESLYPYSYAMGARVHSNSWGSSADWGQYTMETHDVDRFVYDHPDMLILFAAGNDGDAGVTPPATSKNIISVGATVSSNNMMESIWCSGDFQDADMCDWRTHTGSDLSEHLAYFSSIGPTLDGRIKPDLVVPGEFLVSANRICNGSAWTDLMIMEGTSMATPNAAGHMVLIREYLLRGFLSNGQPNPNATIAPSAALLKAVAISGSFSLKLREQYQNGEYLPMMLDVAPDIYQGFGKLKLNHVLYFSNSTAIEKTIIPRGPNGSDPVISQDEIHEYCFQVTSSNSTYLPRFTLVWTDFPAQPVADISLVQDLDLLLLVGDDVYYANGGTDFDRVNNVERAELMGSASVGTLIKVKIIGAYLPVDDLQSYALVASGPIHELNCSEFKDIPHVQSNRSHPGPTTSLNSIGSRSRSVSVSSPIVQSSGSPSRPRFSTSSTPLPSSSAAAGPDTQYPSLPSPTVFSKGINHHSNVLTTTMLVILSVVLI